MIFVGRFCEGLTTGLYSCLTPLYSKASASLVREISPADMAGKFGTYYVLFYRIGFLLSGIAGAWLPDPNDVQAVENSQYWRFMLGFPILIAVLQSVLLIFVFKYETPKFLYLRKKRRTCTKALSKIYASDADIDRVLTKLKAVALTQGQGSAEAGWSELFGRTYVTALLVVLGTSPSTLALHCFQQLAGGNTFMMFSTKIFTTAAKGDHTVPLVGTILAGLVTIDGVFAFSLIADGRGLEDCRAWKKVYYDLRVVCAFPGLARHVHRQLPPTHHGSLQT
eukprot:TRINITY_DN4479_c0_g1_i2.p1 TRINITY_DN4479_c0_g1~~TRINITY_DN4479_c0_g1_i2.p1  ORF type:complete len:280 (-),score=21.23 TRINITY_DN4479_c0_g1_i2:559-1398(-)